MPPGFSTSPTIESSAKIEPAWRPKEEADGLTASGPMKKTDSKACRKIFFAFVVTEMTYLRSKLTWLNWNRFS